MRGATGGDAGKKKTEAGDKRTKQERERETNGDNVKTIPKLHHSKKRQRGKNSGVRGVSAPRLKEAASSLKECESANRKERKWARGAAEGGHQVHLHKTNDVPSRRSGPLSGANTNDDREMDDDDELRGEFSGAPLEVVRGHSSKGHQVFCAEAPSVPLCTGKQNY